MNSNQRRAMARITSQRDKLIIQIGIVKGELEGTRRELQKALDALKGNQ